jgi:hypothetical protein
LACLFGLDNSGLFVRIVRRLELDLLGLFVRIWLVHSETRVRSSWLVCSDCLETRVISSWLVRSYCSETRVKASWLVCLDWIILACLFGSFGDSSIFLACLFGSDNSGLFVWIVWRLELELLGLFVRIWLVLSDRSETRIILACSFGSFGDSG